MQENISECFFSESEHGVVSITNVQAEADMYLLMIAYDPLKEEIGSWHELGSSQASSYRAYSDYESSRVNNRLILTNIVCTVIPTCRHCSSEDICVQDQSAGH